MSEAVLELELTSNRPDCFSIYGIAREVAAAAGWRWRRRPPPSPAVLGGAPAAEAHRRRDRRPRPVPALRARGSSAASRVGESPAWLKARLTHAGMRPISNVVDVTNYVMLGWGQPLHAFDAGKIAATRSSPGAPRPARRSSPSTASSAPLDARDAGDRRRRAAAGHRRRLRQQSTPRSTSTTTDLVLEAANFSGPSILRTELHTGIRSEASNRFEKGLDANLVPGGLDFASRLFAELCGGTVAPGTVDVRRRAGAAAAAALPAGEVRRPARLRRPGAGAGRASCAASSARSTRRGARPSPPGHRQPSEWTVTPPSFRPDLEREVDLIEEVGRIAGYGLPPETLPRHATRRRAHQAAAGAARRAARPGRLRPRRGHHLQLRRARRAGAARSARGRRAPRPRAAQQPDERRAVGDAHHAAARAARRRARQPRPAQRPAQPLRARQGVPVGRRRRARRRRTPPNPAPSCRTSPRPSASCSAGRCRPRTGRARRGPTDFYTLKGVVEAALAALRPAAASSRRSATRRRASRTCIPASRRRQRAGRRRGVGALGLLRARRRGRLRRRGPRALRRPR